MKTAQDDDINFHGLRSRSQQLADLGHSGAAQYIRHPYKTAIMVSYDPSDTYERGALFNRNDFAFTLAQGYWPEGMQVRLLDIVSEILFVVHGDVLTCSTPWVQLRGVIRRGKTTLERI